MADNADLGAGVRNRSFPFSSDFIQDEALAGEVATRFERWGNRLPDTLTLVALNDQNVSPGDVIGVKDQAYGIGLTADADETPYLVLTIARRGDEMTLTCVGGEAGEIGTITTGVEKVCNQTSSDVNIPGLFDPPAISLPPAITVAAYDCGTHGGPNGICPPGAGCFDLLAEPYLSAWQPPSGALHTWTISPGEIVIRSLVASGAPGRGINAGLSIPEHENWHATVTFQIHQTEAAIAAGLTQNGIASDFDGSFTGPDFGAIDEKSASVFTTSDGAAITLSIDTNYTLELDWDATAKELTMAGTGTELVVQEDNGETLWTTPAIPFLLVNLASGGNTGADAVTVTQYDVCWGGCVPLTAAWVDDGIGSGTHDFGDGSDHVDGAAAAHNETCSKSFGDSWTYRATIQVDAGHIAQISMGADASDVLYYAFIDCTAPTPNIQIGSPNESPNDLTDFTGESVEVVLEFDEPNQTLTGTFTGSGSPVVLIADTDDVANPWSGDAFPSIRVIEPSPVAGGATFDDLELT